MKEKLSLLTELIKLAKSDKAIREQEYRFIKVIADRLGINQDELDKLFHQHIGFTPPISEFDRILQFHRLVLLMNVDREVHDKELRMIREMGIRMGLNPMATDKVLDEMDKYPNKIMPSDRLIEIYKAQYN